MERDDCWADEAHGVVDVSDSGWLSAEPSAAAPSVVTSGRSAVVLDMLKESSPWWSRVRRVDPWLVNERISFPASHAGRVADAGARALIGRRLAGVMLTARHGTPCESMCPSYSPRFVAVCTDMAGARVANQTAPPATVIGRGPHSAKRALMRSAQPGSHDYSPLDGR